MRVRTQLVWAARKTGMRQHYHRLLMCPRVYVSIANSGMSSSSELVSSLFLASRDNVSPARSLIPARCTNLNLNSDNWRHY